VIARLKKQYPRPPSGIGLSLSGPVDPQRGCVYLPGKFKNLAGHPTVAYLKKRYRVHVTADNDGRLSCLAEWKLGAGRGAKNLVLLTLGTGIGSGVVLKGVLLNDRSFLLGTQCGHMIIREGGPRCLTLARGTGESICSTTALINAVRDHLARGIPSQLDEVPPDQINFERIVRAVENGDALARELFEEWTRHFSQVLLNAFYAYLPDRIVLSGGPVAAAPLFLKPMEKFLNQNAFRYPPRRRVVIVKALLGDNAGWAGAALQAQLRFAHE
jgi:glucokinase